jgi:RNA polymerase sigma-70 factor (ECF subfamily)
MYVHASSAWQWLRPPRDEPIKIAHSHLVAEVAAVLSIDAFDELMCRVQAGDPDAATELVRQYEPEIRLEARVRLRVQDGRMRRLLDSVDITQSVLCSFFAGVAAGRYAPEHPQQLLGLLVTMARNKLLTQVRNQRRQRRDVRRGVSFDASLHDVAAGGESPSQMMANGELLSEVRKRLPFELMQLADLRGDGWSWAEIAAELGGTAEGRRKQLERAFARILKELQLDEQPTSVLLPQNRNGCRELSKRNPTGLAPVVYGPVHQVP